MEKFVLLISATLFLTLLTPPTYAHPGSEACASFVIPAEKTQCINEHEAFHASGGNNSISVAEPTGAISNISVLISGAVNLIIIIAGLIAFVYLLLGGIKWITSGGDAGQVEAARNQIIQALVGIIVVLAAWALIILIQNITGACFGLGDCAVNLEGLFKE